MNNAGSQPPINAMPIGVAASQPVPFLLQFVEKIPGTVFPSSHSDNPTYMGATQTGGRDRADYETD